MDESGVGCYDWVEGLDGEGRYVLSLAFSIIANLSFMDESCMSAKFSNYTFGFFKRKKREIYLPTKNCSSTALQSKLH